jgi:hypothetical protein
MANLQSTNIFGTLEVKASTTSSSVSSGALVIAGGVGISGNLHIGGPISASSSALTIGTINGLTITTVSGKTLNLANASLTVGGAGRTGNITITSDNNTSKTLTLNADTTINALTTNYALYASSTGTISSEVYLNVSRGGTGVGTFTNDRILVGNAANPIKAPGPTLTASLFNFGSVNSTIKTTGNNSLTLDIEGGAGNFFIGPSIKNITVGSSTVSGGVATFIPTTGNVNISVGAGNTVANNTKTINLGTNGLVNSITNIHIGPTATNAKGEIFLNKDVSLMTGKFVSTVGDASAASGTFFQFRANNPINNASSSLFSVVDNGGNVKFSLDRNGVISGSTWGGGLISIEKGGTGVSTVTPRQALLGPTGTTNNAPSWRLITSADISDANVSNSAGTIVIRNASGGFSASTITANFNGVATKANVLNTSRTLWGQTFDGSASVSGNIVNTNHITPVSGNTSNIGTTSNKYNTIHLSSAISIGKYEIKFNNSLNSLDITYNTQ